MPLVIREEVAVHDREPAYPLWVTYGPRQTISRADVIPDDVDRSLDTGRVEQVLDELGEMRQSCVEVRRLAGSPEAWQVGNQAAQAALEVWDDILPGVGGVKDSVEQQRRRPTAPIDQCDRHV